MKRLLINICCLIGLSLGVYGQGGKMDLSAQLQVGEVFPGVGDLPLLNYEKKGIQLHKLEGKVVILDFFDTYCANCIASMPKLKKLQEKLGDKLLVIMVGWQDRKTLEKFYQTNGFLKENKTALPTIYGDTLLKKYFPYQGVPHVAWLYQGKVQAITHSDFVDEVNVNLLLKNGKIHLPRKNDFREKAGLDTVLTSDSKMLGTVAISGYNDERVPFDGVHMDLDSGSTFFKTYFTNVGVLDAYKALMAKIEKPEFLTTARRIVWKVSDSSKYMYKEGSGGINVWLAKHGICYERKDLIKRPENEQAKIVMEDLNRFMGLNVYWGKKEMECLVIRKTTPNKQKDELKGRSIEGTGVLAFLLDYSEQYLPAVDEAGYKGKIMLGEHNNVKEMNNYLQYYGLEVVVAKRELKVLYIEEKI